MKEQIKIIKSRSNEDLFRFLSEIEKTQHTRVLILSFSDESSVEFDRELLDLIKHFPIPIILIIKKIVSNNLFEFVLASHICIASEYARFEISNRNSLEKYIGSKNIDKLTIIKNEIDAETALELGIINKVVNENELEKAAFAMAEKISKLAPIAIRSCLKAVNAGLELDLEDGLKLETKLFNQIFATEDMKEGTSAFFEKRTPIFKGK